LEKTQAVVAMNLGDFRTVVCGIVVNRTVVCCSNDDLLHFGAIICMLGTRYKSYCSNIVRTMLVGPTDQMQKNYDTLLKVFEAILDKLRPGKGIRVLMEALSPQSL